MQKSLGAWHVLTIALLGVFIVSATTAFAQEQVLTPNFSVAAAPANAPVSIDVTYTTDPAGQLSTGLGLRLHFDSSQLAFQNLTNQLTTSIQPVGPPQLDTSDFDGAPNTDMFQLVSWLDFGGVWPPGNFPVSLYTANFVTTADFSGSTVNLTASQTPISFAFRGETGAISFMVDPPDDPVAVDDTGTTQEDTPVTINVLANDSDPDLGETETLTVSDVTQPNNGTVVNNTTDITYTPADNVNGTDMFTYTVQDSTGRMAMATVTVTVDAVNDQPVAEVQAVNTSAGTPVEIILSGSDVDEDALTFGIAAAPSNGTLLTEFPNVTYTPNAGFEGEDSFTFTVNDGTANSEPATVTITVTNTLPVAVAQAVTTSVGVPVEITLEGNDEEGAALAFTIATQPNNGMLTSEPPAVTYTPNADFIGEDTFTFTVNDGIVDSTPGTVTITVNPNAAPVAMDDAFTVPEDVPADDPRARLDVLANDEDADSDNLTIMGMTQPMNGTAVDSGDGAIIYTPVANYFGPDQFTYTISDGNGGMDTANVTINVLDVNDLPIARDDERSTEVNTAIDIDVLVNDEDIDGELVPATVTITSGPANGTTEVNDGVITYTPNAGFFDSDDTFTYTVADDDGDPSEEATVTVTVAGDRPIANNDSAETDEDTAVSINVTENDEDSDGAIDPTSVMITAAPVSGTATPNPDGTITYLPNADFAGTDTFMYQVLDDTGIVSNVATVTVTVNAINDRPVANADMAETLQDTAVIIPVLDNDEDVDGPDEIVPASVQVIGQPASGTAAVNTDDGSITYTPNNGFVGLDTFTYTVADNGEAVSEEGIVTIGVMDPDNLSPDAMDDTAMTNQDEAVTIAVLENDMDPNADDTLTILEVTQPANGSVMVDTAEITYTPDAGFSGIDDFTYRITDGRGGLDGATVTVMVEAIAPNIPPGATPQNVSTEQNTLVAITLTGTDENDDPLTFSITGGPTNGTIIGTPPTVTYRPNNNFIGGDSFTFVANDGEFDSAPATVSITVTEAPVPPVEPDAPTTPTPDVNTPPVATPQDVTTDAGAFVEITLIGADTDNDALTFSIIDDPTNGTLSGVPPVITYTPNADFSGTDSFAFIVNDGEFDSTPETVSITVADAPEPPSVPVDITTPMANDVVAGDAVAVAVFGADVPLNAMSVRFQYRPANNGVGFSDIGEEALAPAFFIVPWDTTVLVNGDGDYELRAIVTLNDGSMAESPLLGVTVDNTVSAQPDIMENAATGKTEGVLANADNTVITSNGVIVEIPEEALAADDMLRVITPEEVPENQPGVPAAQFVDISLANGGVDFPAGNPIMVSLPYADTDPDDGIVDNTNIPETALTLWFFDDEAGVWTQVPDAMVEEGPNVITGLVTHLTPFGVFNVAPPDGEDPVVVTIGANSPGEDVFATLPVSDLPVLQLQLATDADEAATVNSVRVDFPNQNENEDILGTVTVRVVADLNGNGSVDAGEPTLAEQNGINATQIFTLDPALEIAADSVANLLVTLTATGVTGTGSSSSAFLTPQTPPSRMTWLLLLTPALGLVLFSRWRQGSSKSMIGLLALVFCCSVLLVGCPNDGGGANEFVTASSIPANAVTGQGAASGPFTAPDEPLAGIQVTIQE